MKMRRPTFTWVSDAPDALSGTAFFNLGDMALIARFDDEYVAHQLALMMQRAWDKGPVPEAVAAALLPRPMAPGWRAAP